MTRKLSEFIQSEKMANIRRTRLVQVLIEIENDMEEALRLLKLSLLDVDKESDIFKAISKFLKEHDDQ